MPCLLAILLVLAAALAAGCGTDDGEPASATTTLDPAVVAEAVADRVAVEQIRARLTAASELYALGRAEDALAQLRAAEGRWRALAGAVGREDPVLAREIRAALRAVERAMLAGATFDTVRDRLSPVNSQLLDGVVQALVPAAPRREPAVGARVLDRILRQAQAEYARGLAVGGERGMLALEHAYGLIVRSQAVARDIAADLGPQRDAVIEGLKDLRERAYPEGVDLPASLAPLGAVKPLVDDVRAALAARFRDA